MPMSSCSGARAAGERPAVSLGRLLRAGVEVVFCVALPLVALVWAFDNAIRGGDVTDFEFAFYPAAGALLDGANPYPQLDAAELGAGVAFVYPPLTAIASIPFTALSAGAAGVIVMALSVLAVVGTLAVLGIRDWRCYGIVFAWPAVFSAVMVGNISIPLALAAALVWRYRDRFGPAAVSLGVGLAAKLILWPLGIWLLATRRFRTAFLALVLAAIVVTLSWAAIGFDGIGQYPRLLRRIQELEEANGYTVYALALDFGASTAVARVAGVAVAVLLLAAVVLYGRRGDDRRAFIAAIAAALACTPIVWLHYFAFLVVVVAVAQPRLGPLWFVPLGMYVSSGTFNGTPFQTAMTIATAALTIAFALRPTTPRGALSFVPSTTRPELAGKAT